MNEQTVFVFSGQGSQYYNMGKELYSKDITFRKNMLSLDRIFEDITGCSVISHLYSQEKPAGMFEDTYYTHPAIFMLEYSLAQTLIEKSVYPDYVLGSSLGEYAACAVANVLSCEAALECIVKQVEMLQNKCVTGGMIAVIDNCKIYEDTPIIYNNSELVSINYVSHFVISAPEQELKEIKNYLKKNRIMHVKLPIQYAFHSQWIESLGEEYTKYLKTINYKSPKINIVSCMKGSLIKDIDYEYLWKVVREPINFIDAIKVIDEKGDFNYVDLGPSGTMSNFIKYHIPKEKWAKIFPIVTPAHKELLNIDKVCESTVQIAY